MKASNLTLAVAAVLTATISAYASLSMSLPHYVQIKYCSDANFTCSTTNVCDDQTTNPCKVRVNGVLASVFETKSASGTTCSTIVTTSQPPPNVSKTRSICDAILIP